jgi:hypothetical protein
MNWKRILGACIVFPPIFVMLITRPIETMAILGGLMAVGIAALVWFGGLYLLLNG